MLLALILALFADPLWDDEWPKKYDVEIDTYDDHRMAMAFAPLALKNNIKIKNEKVVTKSYPAFWKDLQSIGFQVIKI